MGKTYAGPREDMSDAIGAAVRAADGAVYTAKGYRRDTADDAAGDTRTGMDAPGGASKDRKAISAERRSALVRCALGREGASKDDYHRVKSKSRVKQEMYTLLL